MNVTIRYNLSEAGRRASILAGGNGKREQTVTVPADSPLFATAVSLANVREDGTATVPADHLRTATGYPREYDAPQDAAALIADMQAEDARKQAEAEERKREAAERRAAFVAEILAEPIADQITTDYAGRPEIRAQILNVSDYPELAERMAALRAELAARLDTWQAQRDAAAKRKEAEDAAKAEKRATFKRQLEAWVKANGSDTSRMRLEEGFDSWFGAALEEWDDAQFSAITLELAEDLPGTDGRPVAEDRKSPTAGELTALRDARKALAGKPFAVSLKWVRYDRAEDADDDTPEKQYRAELEVELTRPDGTTATQYYLV